MTMISHVRSIGNVKMATLSRKGDTNE